MDRSNHWEIPSAARLLSIICQLSLMTGLETVTTIVSRLPSTHTTVNLCSRLSLKVSLFRTVACILKTVGHPRFFLGTDSAPHPRHMKESAQCSAGVYTGYAVTQYLAHVLDSFGAMERFNDFACVFGRRFYGLPESKHSGRYRLVQEPFKVPAEIDYKDAEDSTKQVKTIVPFLAGKTLKYSLQKL